MENLNAVFINDRMSQSERLVKLNKIAIQQMRILEDTGDRKLLKQLSIYRRETSQYLVQPVERIQLDDYDNKGN